MLPCLLDQSLNHMLGLRTSCYLSVSNEPITEVEEIPPSMTEDCIGFESMQ